MIWASFAIKHVLETPLKLLDAKLGIFRVFPVDTMMILMTDFVGKFVNDIFEKEYILKALDQCPFIAF